MGAFDSVYAECPRCGDNVEFQSKAGDCLMNIHHPSRVPALIAADLNGQTWTCDCGGVVMLGDPAPALVEMRVRLVEDGG